MWMQVHFVAVLYGQEIGRYRFALAQLLQHDYTEYSTA